MLKILKIWSAVFAIAIVSLKTWSEIARDHPITHAIDTYLLGIWLISGLLFPRTAPSLLLSGWAVATGKFYGAMADNLTYPDALTFVQVYFVIITILSLGSLLIANYLFIGPQQNAPEQGKALAAKRIRYGAILLGSLLIIALFLGWRVEGYALFVIPYYVIAVGLFPASFFYPTHPKVLFIVFGFALGYFESVFRFIIYDEPEAPVLIFTIVVIALLLLGIYFIFRNIALQEKIPKRRI